MKAELQDIGYKNVVCFPNFRFFNHAFNPHHIDGELHLVFMARVNKLKGLDTIFNFSSYLKSKEINNIFIDFWGPVFLDDSEYFYENIELYPFIQYKGVLLPEKIHATLEQYDAMLLPTHYYTEGLPGSIVDAYISGIPVIATEWKHSHEFVNDGKTGFIVPFENSDNAFRDAIMNLLDNSLLDALKHNSFSFSKRFNTLSALKIIKSKIRY